MKQLFFVLMFGWSATVYGQDTLRLSLLFTGDIMQHDTQISGAFIPDSGIYDYKPCFEFVKPILSASDLTIGNLEVTLAGPPYKGYPQFSAPDELLDALKDAGFDVLVTANNHCVDRGRNGLERTIDLLDKAEMLHTGTFKDTVDWLNDNPLLIHAKGFRLSLLNYTYGTNGIPIRAPNVVNMIDTARIRQDIQKANDQHTDAIIVFMHWGEEYKSMPNDWQRRLADFCLKQGAKMVIGSHPHVLQPIEWRREKDQLVAYSLGNFVSAQYDRYKNGGLMLYVNLEKIVQPDHKADVRIEDVTYSLEYVYRAANRRMTYHILPIEQFENDTTFVRRKVAHDYMIQFRDDSRALYEKENKNVKEKFGLKP